MPHPMLLGLRADIPQLHADLSLPTFLFLLPIMHMLFHDEHIAPDL